MTGRRQIVDRLIDSRQRWLERDHPGARVAAGVAKQDCEGGCGVIGTIASEPVAGRYLYRPLAQMNNRGNGKGGGIAVAGCFPRYPHHFALHVAYMDPDVRGDLERRFIDPTFLLADTEELPTADDYRDVGRLEIRPPDVVRYFVRVRPDAIERMAAELGIEAGDAAEAEVVNRNTFALNREFYDAADPRAFVMSQGRNLMILKGVGFAEDILRYYLLDDFEGHVWIGHQRYPTRGRVWHPGGAHPFAGLDEALVHNGDLANYQAIVEYLGQKGIAPLFLTDTEVAILLFDLYNRAYRYPLEYICEALAPTTERDFEMLPKDKQRVYRALRASHLHGSPDGPFFFIIARSMPGTQGAGDDTFELVGITDTSMLRPQVFAMHTGELEVGLIASEKQAIDAYLEDLSAEDHRVAPMADRYWNARGGSYSDGGAFVFSTGGGPGAEGVRCSDKFGQAVELPRGRRQPRYPLRISAIPPSTRGTSVDWATVLDAAGAEAAFEKACERAAAWDLGAAERIVGDVVGWTRDEPARRAPALEFLTLLLDQRYDPGTKKPSAMRAMAQAAIVELLETLPLNGEGNGDRSRRVIRETASKLGPPPPRAGMLAVDARGFEIEGPDSVARLTVRACELGWKHVVVFGCAGHRFLGCGLGPDSRGIRFDVYGASGDYLGSGLDGAEIHVHGDAQDQVGQILKSGRIVIHGHVGQTLLYGAKGGEVFIRGNTAGRPLINAVGNVRVVVNGTCLDYAAESFMAGRHIDGGFLVINGITNLDDGRVYGLETKYPGTNLFSLASGGCCYLNDPYGTVSDGQLNGARFDPFLQEDWNVLEPYLQENQRLFRIDSRYDLLMVDGVLRWPKEVFRKVVPRTAPEPVE